MSYRVTVRRAATVARFSAVTLEAALDAVEAAARDAARSERRAPVDLRVRAYAPGDQVVARVEVHGGGVRAGVDVHGDGSMTAHTGRVRRAPIEKRPDETALAALRRAVG
jgi:hypothetical protein